jgi:Flp pilus assembly protein CpaB
MSVPVVTLLVDPVQAESLTLAASEGHIQLVLRNSNDQLVAATGGRQLRDLYAHGAPAPVVAAVEQHAPRARPAETPAAVAPLRPAPALAPVAPPPPAGQTVILIRGNQKILETFPVEVRGHEN